MRFDLSGVGIEVATNRLSFTSYPAPGVRTMGAQAHEDAIERAEQLRPLFDELAGLSARKIAAALNERKIATPTGGVWHAATVIRVQKRLAKVRD